MAERSQPFQEYRRSLEEDIRRGDATEHTHRPTLKSLLEAFAPGITATNEPKRMTDVGAPDIRVLRGPVPIGYIETKDVGASLDAVEKSEQLRRYRASLGNLILTDYLEFRWYMGGQHRLTARLGQVDGTGRVRLSPDGTQEVAGLLQQFYAQSSPIVGTPLELAQRMAALAQLIHSLIQETFQQEAGQGPLHTQLEAFKDVLIPDLQPPAFADMYAQTIAYGLFAARCNAPDNVAFTRQSAAWDLPRTNPFLRNLFSEIAGPGLDDRIAWAVDDLAQLLARADMAAILKDFGKGSAQQDPVVHFYETFLKRYDPKLRELRGVYYTPEPVVSYIVRSIDHLLKTRFNRPKGLADESVLILDPACGTGTFLYAVIQHIRETFQGNEGMWNGYVRAHLLPRIFGFELLMAPYSVAHLNLGILLKETGYDFSGDERLGIYLTNTLEEAAAATEQLGFTAWLSKEGQDAAEIKREKPIMVVLGNPPYSVSSANKGEQIDKLMERFKTAVKGEQNIQPLSDDYVKFIRFAHDRIERTGYGIVGMITNHIYLSGLIHRGVREELLKSFQEIFALDLHGNSIVQERTPTGGVDQNVFDIRQGVAISLLVKSPKEPNKGETLAHVFHCDVWGTRRNKHAILLATDVASTSWEESIPKQPGFFFVPNNPELAAEYQTGLTITKILSLSSSGVKTHRDHFAVAFDQDVLYQRIQEFRSTGLSNAEIRERFDLSDTGTWQLDQARNRVQRDDDWRERLIDYRYRPFDSRTVFYHEATIERPRMGVMRHLLKQNIALVLGRAGHVVHADEWAFVTSVNTISDVNIFYRGGGVVFPLYLYPSRDQQAEAADITSPWPAGKEGRRPNLSPEFVAEVGGRLGLRFVSDGRGDLKATFGPVDVFYYAYAVFHSPTYRSRYAEFLKIDFPRLPLTSDRALFAALADKGAELAALHLLESPTLEAQHMEVLYGPKGSDVVEKVTYQPPKDGRQGRVAINQAQGFEGVSPQVWEFHVGGYQVCEKWLKDRKGRVLTYEDQKHYQKIVVALGETLRLMAEIDAVVPSWPIQ